jgi:peptidyl-prolyl cis-trans isomerase C
MNIKINGEVLPAEAVQFELNRLMQYHAKLTNPQQARKEEATLRRQAVDQAIGAKLLITEAMRLDFKIPAAVLEKKMDRVVSDAGGRAKFDEMLRRQAIPETRIREGIERSAKVEKLIEKITEDVPDPTEKEILEHFQAHSAEYARVERAQVRHILIKPESSSDQNRNVARSRLLEIKDRIENGADFGDEASAHSHCPSGKKKGGNLGWVSRGAAIPELDAALFSMDVDELSEPVETPLGFHLLHKTAHDEGGEVTLDQVSDKVRDFLRHVRRGQAISAYVDDLKKKAVIEIVE